jgi:hypothetical protein
MSIGAIINKAVFVFCAVMTKWFHNILTASTIGSFIPELTFKNKLNALRGLF